MLVALKVSACRGCCGEALDGSLALTSCLAKSCPPPLRIPNRAQWCHELGRIAIEPCGKCTFMATVARRTTADFGW